MESESAQEEIPKEIVKDAYLSFEMKAPSNDADFLEVRAIKVRRNYS